MPKTTGEWVASRVRICLAREYSNMFNRMEGRRSLKYRRDLSLSSTSRRDSMTYQRVWTTWMDKTIWHSTLRAEMWRSSYSKMNCWSTRMFMRGSTASSDRGCHFLNRLRMKQRYPALSAPIINNLSASYATKNMNLPPSTLREWIALQYL